MDTVFYNGVIHTMAGRTVSALAVQNGRIALAGTDEAALALADAVNESLGNEYHYKYDRTAERVKRDKKEIGIQAIRGGSIVGEHDVIFAGQDEVVTFQHTAYSKAIFAKGAVQGAKFLAGKAPGMYDMADVIG